MGFRNIPRELGPLYVRPSVEEAPAVVLAAAAPNFFGLIMPVRAEISSLKYILDPFHLPEWAQRRALPPSASAGVPQGAPA